MYRLLVELLQPYPLFLLLGWLGLANLWRKRRETRRRLILPALGLGGLTLISLPAVAYFVVGTLEWQSPPLGDFPDDAEAIVVLGGSVAPPDATRARAELTPDSIYRSLHTLDLYRRRPLLVLVSGGKVEPSQPDPAVAEAMADFLRERGVESELIIEKTSRTTHENAVESCRMLETRGVQRIILVTEALHMPRAERCFRKQGMNVIPAACAYQTPRMRFDLYAFVPSPHAAFDCERTVHEWLGMIWYWVNGRV